MSDMIEAVAREVQHAVEQMPYRDFTELTADGSAERPTTLREFFENTWQGEHADEVFSAAAQVATRTAITAHTAALIAGAGELERWGPAYSREHDTDEMQPMPNGGWVRYDQAAAAIAAQKAEIERLTEREARAKLDGVKAGIEASAVQCEWPPEAPVKVEYQRGLMTGCILCERAILALDAEAIAKGERGMDVFVCNIHGPVPAPHNSGWGLNGKRCLKCEHEQQQAIRSAALADLIAGDAHLIDAPYATKADSGRECGHPACALYGRCMTGDCQLRGRTLADSDGDDGA